MDKPDVKRFQVLPSTSSSSFSKGNDGKPISALCLLCELQAAPFNPHEYVDIVSRKLVYQLAQDEDGTTDREGRRCDRTRHTRLTSLANATFCS